VYQGVVRPLNKFTLLGLQRNISGEGASTGLLTGVSIYIVGVGVSTSILSVGCGDTIVAVTVADAVTLGVSLAFGVSVSDMSIGTVGIGAFVGLGYG
jgi:N-acetylglutamate synthase-like GNAT family acetyltransferase